MVHVQINDVHMYIPVPMIYMWRLYFLIIYCWSYQMEINNWSAYKWYTHTYILVPMMYMCRWYFLSTHWYTYGMKITNWSTTICLTLSTPHISYKEWNYMWVQIDTIYYLKTNDLLCHIFHIRNANLCGTVQISHEFIWDSDQLEPFFFHNTYISTCGYMCYRHSKNQWFKIQCPIWYM